MKYIHLKCLKKWIYKRIPVNNNSNVINLPIKKISCELCKSRYPLAIYFNGNIYETISIKVPNYPYMIAESESKDLIYMNLSSKNFVVVKML